MKWLQAVKREMWPALIGIGLAAAFFLTMNAIGYSPSRMNQISATSTVHPASPQIQHDYLQSSGNNWDISGIVIGLLFWLIGIIWNWLREAWPWMLLIGVAYWGIKGIISDAIEDAIRNTKHEISDAVKEGVEKALRASRFD